MEKEILKSWLEKRIRITTKERDCFDYKTNQDLRVGKGAKVTVYKEMLDFLDKH